MDNTESLKTLMILVNVPFQISSGIFVYGEIIKMHTVHEMETVKRIKN